MHHWLVMSFLISQTLSLPAPASDLILGLKNVFFSQQLAMDLNSYQRVTPSTLQLSSSKYQNEYLGYLSKFLYNERVPPRIKDRGMEVKKLLSYKVQEVPYHGQINQPTMLNLSLDFDTKFAVSLH